MSPRLLRTALLTLVLVPPAAVAVDRVPAHDHHVPPGGLHLNHGQRWATTAPLRQGMGGIREAVLAAMPAATAQPLTAAEADRLADAIRTQVDYLVAHCVLAPEADAVLHVLLGELLEGAAALRRNPADADALPRIVAALREYPRYFADENWKPLTRAP